VKERPTSGGTIHPDDGRDFETLPSQSLYHKETLAVKGVCHCEVAKTCDFKFRKSVEPTPPPAPAPSDDARAGGRLRALLLLLIRPQSLPLRLKRVPGTETNMLVLSEQRVQWVTKCSDHWAEPGRIFEQQAAFL
jgi:hypothetical protein